MTAVLGDEDHRIWRVMSPKDYCKNCEQHKEAHIDAVTCPFEPTEFVPGDEVIEVEAGTWSMTHVDPKPPRNTGNIVHYTPGKGKCSPTNTSVFATTAGVRRKSTETMANARLTLRNMRSPRGKNR